MAGVALWLLVRVRRAAADQPMYRSGVQLGAWVVLVAGLGVAVTGDIQGKIMTDVAADEDGRGRGAVRRPDSRRPFSIFTIGSLDGSEESSRITMPELLSFLATGSFDGKVEGINQLRAQYREDLRQDPGATYYSPGGYTPIIPVTYWSFRLMIGLGMLAAALGAAPPVAHPARPGSRRSALAARGRRPAFPAAASVTRSAGSSPRWAASHGWSSGVMTTAHGVSPGVSAGEALHLLIALTALYGVLMVVEFGLLLKLIRAGRRTVRGTTRPDARGRRRRPRPSAGVRLLSRGGAMPWSSPPSGSAHRHPVDRLLRPGGFRLRRRHAAAGAGPGTTPSGGCMINTIGPVWDGNEVWLLVAGGATFAAFPEWYATLFSGFYLPLLLILVALIVRGVAFEYRHKRDDAAWRARWDRAIFVGSFVPALLWGVAFANIVRGVPIDADKEYAGIAPRPAQPVRAARRR